MKHLTKVITGLIKKNIMQIDPHASVFLFGSRARNDERSDSDWDILVLTDYEVDLKKENEFRHHLYNLELETGQPFSVFAFSKHDWTTNKKMTPFYKFVEKEGILL